MEVEYCVKFWIEWFGVSVVVWVIVMCFRVIFYLDIFVLFFFI